MDLLRIKNVAYHFVGYLTVGVVVEEIAVTGDRPARGKINEVGDTDKVTEADAFRFGNFAHRVYVEPNVGTNSVFA